MRRYVQVSGAFFFLLAAAQLTRAVLGWPIRVDHLTIPVWHSVVAFLVTAALGIWALRSLRSDA